VENSDKLYSVIEGATSKVPYGDQQQFFTDLAVRLTPPDLLSIECRGKNIALGSSRAARVDFVADGVSRTYRTSGGGTVRSRISLGRDSLTFNSGGAISDTVSFTFTPLENGNRLRVVRRISSAELVEPIVIQTVYHKISAVARWDIYVEELPDRQVAGQSGEKTLPASVSRNKNPGGENNEAETLRRSLDEWIEATNARDIEKQMSFYMPQLEAFYLARDASQSLVRAEKNRAFASARAIDIQAAEPEFIFQNAGRLAIMRFRKNYNIRNRSGVKSGEVVQELRWRRTNRGWRIFSERDIRVLR
jgi:ketosteroid isomerase-like protein